MRPTEDPMNETEEVQEGLPRHRRHRKPASDQLLGFRNVLNIIFMVLAIIGVVVYLWFDSTIGTYIVIGGMAFKMVECCIRMLR